MANSVDPDQTAPIGAVCSGSTLSASILNSSVMLGNYLQQTTSVDDIFGCALRVKTITRTEKTIREIVEKNRILLPIRMLLLVHSGFGDTLSILNFEKCFPSMLT